MRDISRVRLARNELAFRRANEIIAAAHRRRAWHLPTTLDFVCECCRPTCRRRIRLTSSEYADLRTSTRQFAVYPGHVEPQIEFVAATADRFWTVEKDGVAGAFANAEACASPCGAGAERST